MLQLLINIKVQVCYKNLYKKKKLIKSHRPLPEYRNEICTSFFQ